MQPPSGLRNSQLPPSVQQPGQPPVQPPPGQNPQQRAGKRASNSPGQEVSTGSAVIKFGSNLVTDGPPPQPEQLSKTDASPPDRKRVRRSPESAEAGQPPMYPLPSGGGPPMQPSHMPPNMMRGGPMSIQPFNGQPPMAGLPNPMMNHGMTTPQMSPMNPPMNPGMMNMPGGVNAPGGGPGGMTNGPQLPQLQQVRPICDPRIDSFS